MVGVGADAHEADPPTSLRKALESVARRNHRVLLTGNGYRSDVALLAEDVLAPEFVVILAPRRSRTVTSDIVVGIHEVIDPVSRDIVPMCTVVVEESRSAKATHYRPAVMIEAGLGISQNDALDRRKATRSLDPDAKERKVN